MGITQEGDIVCCTCIYSVDFCPGIENCRSKEIILLVEALIFTIYVSVEYYKFFINRKLIKENLLRHYIFNTVILCVCFVSILSRLIVSIVSNNTGITAYLVVYFLEDSIEIACVFLVELKLLSCVEVLKSYEKIRIIEYNLIQKLCLLLLFILIFICFITIFIAYINISAYLLIINLIMTLLIINFIIICVPLIYTCFKIYKTLLESKYDKVILNEIKKKFILATIFCIFALGTLGFLFYYNYYNELGAIYFDVFSYQMTIVVCYVCFKYVEK